MKVADLKALQDNANVVFTHQQLSACFTCMLMLQDTGPGTYEAEETAPVAKGGPNESSQAQADGASAIPKGALLQRLQNHPESNCSPGALNQN